MCGLTRAAPITKGNSVFTRCITIRGWDHLHGLLQVDHLGTEDLVAASFQCTFPFVLRDLEKDVGFQIDC